MKVGKRISTHPLHETFLGPEWKERERRDEYYERSVPGALVADLDSQCQLEFEDVGEGKPEGLTRLQRVFTSPIERLVDAWGEAAKLLRSGKHASPGRELGE